MFLTVSNGCWLSLTVSTSAIELLQVSHCLFQFHEVEKYPSLYPMVAGCLQLSL